MAYDLSTDLAQWRIGTDLNWNARDLEARFYPPILSLRA
jgi:hypothetical protein